jgi:predicted metal-dependent hydrolase
MIEFDLIYEERNTLAITVSPDKSVLVKAPIGSTEKEIDERLLRRAKWILKQINYFDQFHPVQPPREYVSGETHYYLGRQYRLRIRKSNQESVRLIGKFFIVKTGEVDDRESIKLLMKQWYADHAMMLIDRRSRQYLKEIVGKQLPVVKIQYKYLKKKWGSSDPTRGITFNIELIKTPLHCVDYVIVHELCHLIHPNHDKGFYRLMGRVLPDWRDRKKRLEAFGARH